MGGLLDKMVLRTGKPPSKNSNVQKAIFRKGVRRTREFERIRALPRRRLHLDEIFDLSETMRIERGCTGCLLCRDVDGDPIEPRLWPIQSALLLEAVERRGALGPIGVGYGKTLISLLVPTVTEARRPLLLVPPQTRTQLLVHDLPLYSRHFMISPTLTVVAYSQLSLAKSCNLLDELEPDLIIADEAHNLRHFASARTKRVKHYVKEHPECAFVALSGTLTTKSLHDYAHLSEWALRAGSPVPGNWGELEDWSLALDVSEDPLHPPMAPGVLLEFCTDEEQAQAAKSKRDAQDAARKGFHRRLVETAGVVATAEGALGTSLIIRALYPQVPPEILAALKKLETEWKLGDEELEDATAYARAARQLSCGFYYRWQWLNGKPDQEWLDARAAWHRAVRNYTQGSRKGLDSAKLVASAAEAYARGRGEFSYGAQEWAAWARVKDRPKPKTETVWLSDFLLREIDAWRFRLSDEENGIIWVEHKGMLPALAARGYSVFGGGTDAALLAAHPKTHPVIVCSIKAHGTGKNLQAWSRALVTSSPSNGATWEQMLGRLHRSGQLADEVTYDVFRHTDAMRHALDDAINDARYIETTNGNRQKLLYATKLLDGD